VLPLLALQFVSAALPDGMRLPPGISMTTALLLIAALTWLAMCAVSAIGETVIGPGHRPRRFVVDPAARACRQACSGGSAKERRGSDVARHREGRLAEPATARLRQGAHCRLCKPYALDTFAELLASALQQRAANSLAIEQARSRRWRH
jgi:hypothetical protein